MLRCLLAAAVLAAPAFHAAAQTQRAFPGNALRGEFIVTLSPEVLLNGKPARLSPGSRIWDGRHMLIVPGAITGEKFTVHYTATTDGQVRDVWLLRKDELDRLWPKNAEQAATWRFDPPSNTWTKP